MDDDEPITIYTAVPKGKQAKKIANKIIEKHEAASVNILHGKMLSIFRWKNRIEKKHEVLVFIHTTRGRFDDVCKTIKKHHPYEVPYIKAFSVAAVEKKGLAWLLENSARPRQHADREPE